MGSFGRWIWMMVAALALVGGSATASAETKGETRQTRRGHAAFEVLWGGSWWRAEVLERRAGLIKIHYTGWGAEWDEWITPARLRQVAVHAPLKAGKTGQQVDIEWHGSWWDGQIIDVRSGLYKVHYSGWGNEWDEWVEPNRLRVRSK